MKILSIKTINKLPLGLAFLFVLLLAASCNKESLTEVPSTQMDNNEITVRTTGDGVIDYSLAEDVLMGINYDEIMVDDVLQALSFPSEDVLGATIDIIEDANEVLEAEISSSIAGLSEDEIDLMDINDYFVYEAFEAHFPAFQSYRAQKAQAEVVFFANNDLNDDEDPSIIYGAIPDAFGTVLNVFGEVITLDGVQAPQQVHVARQDGTNYTVMNGDPATVIDLRTDFTYHNDDPSIKIVDDGGGYGGSQTAKCVPHYIKPKTKYIEDNDGNKTHRAQLEVGVRNSSFLFFTRYSAYSELKSYKRKKNGNGWKRHRTFIDVSQTGTVYDGGDCMGDSLPATASKSHNHWKCKAKQTYTSKISASDVTTGGNVILEGEFDWEGQNYTLRLF